MLWPMEYSDQTLYISDLASAEGVNYVIDGSTFKDCILRGPAVVHLSQTDGSGGGVAIPHQDVNTVVITAEPGRSVIPIGVVVIRNCKFDGCTFDGITFFAPAEAAEALSKNLMANVPS